ncbi:hypothetical protein ACFSSC_00050 [Corynebacterium mendelii]|uniref:Uncharacterized protein n=1 Tax=Corynebacterium mendelii TaxID=2765362 RepID=A0A939E0W6_9CORY|nr:hypothetical protein [Corynebacterium mendelii]MBN9643681.1 hypothetical protein [Corynebacterium mendelii]
MDSTADTLTDELTPWPIVFTVTGTSFVCCCLPDYITSPWARGLLTTVVTGGGVLAAIKQTVDHVGPVIDGEQDVAGPVHLEEETNRRAEQLLAQAGIGNRGPVKNLALEAKALAGGDTLVPAAMLAGMFAADLAISRLLSRKAIGWLAGKGVNKPYTVYHLGGAAAILAIRYLQGRGLTRAGRAGHDTPADAAAAKS